MMNLENLTNPSTPGSAMATVRAGRTHPTGLHILVVDDDPDLLSFVTHGLRIKHRPVSARTAEQALDLLRAGLRFDLLLSGVPAGRRVKGIDLVKEALGRDPEMSVIVMGDARQGPVRLPYGSVGVADILLKPFRLCELDESLERAARNRRSFLREPATKRSFERIWHAAAEAFALSLDAKDHETRGHAERVVAFSLRLGREMGLTDQDLNALALGARLHDVGKIAIHDAVLKKPSQLDSEEWKQMRTHPIEGQRMVRRMRLPEEVALVVGQHHERWDGEGYPRGLKGAEIYIGARVFSVVDAFDAITADRVYRRGRSYEAALGEITAHQHTQFDPGVVAAFSRIDAAEWDEIRARCETYLENQLGETPC